jgi:hypothetical protein
MSIAFHMLKFSSNYNGARSKSHSTVEWSRIFSKLESSISDVLILLDSTGAGSFTSTESNGGTELIAACAFKESLNIIKQPSFTGVLVETLQRLSRMPPFTVNYLYNCLLENCLAVREFHGRKVDPIHIILGQDKRRPRSIRFPTNFKPIRHSMGSGGPLQSSLVSTALEGVSTAEGTGDERRMVATRRSEAPALFLSIRIPEFAELEDLSTELFREWLRELPIPTDSVVVQWGTVSY